MDIPRASLVPGQVIEGVMVGGGTLEGDTRMYRCADYTVMEGDPQTTCRLRGETWGWDPVDLYCRRKYFFIIFIFMLFV